MAISAAPLEMQAKKPSASISKVKGEVRRSSTRLKTSWFSHRAYIKRVCIGSMSNAATSWVASTSAVLVMLFLGFSLISVAIELLAAAEAACA